MPQPNRIAVIGHRGWASSGILGALAASSALVKVLHRSSSDVSMLHSNITKAEVDFDHQDSLIAALQDVDIVISLVGHEGVERQQAIVKAIPYTNVKLFSPSDLAARYDEQGLRVPVNRMKDNVEKAAQTAGIPMTIILTGNFAEFALNTMAMGVDIAGNRLVSSGDSMEQKLNLWSYVAAAYAEIFSKTPISAIQGRIIGLSEIQVTGNDIASALETKHGRAPQLTEHSIEEVNNQVENCLQNGSPFALAWYCRKIWGTGQIIRMVGNDIWGLAGYSKVTLEDLIVHGTLENYRDMSLPVSQYFDATFSHVPA